MNIAINGFGRIGRHTLRNLIARQLPNINIIAINDLTDPATLAHLLKYDSVHGPFPGEVLHGDDFIQVNGTKIHILREKNPAALPWSSLAIDLVIESTGFFTTYNGASLHLQAGAKQCFLHDQ